MIVTSKPGEIVKITDINGVISTEYEFRDEKLTKITKKYY